MSTRRLLFLDATGLTAYLWQAGLLHREGHFPADDSGPLALAEYLRSRRDSLFRLLVDVAEEGFQTEDIPYVQGRDRRALIQRKLGQYFYGSPLVTAISLGRQKQGRRDERMLFAGLTGYATIEPWLQALRQTESRLAGIYPLPLVIGCALAPLIDGTDRGLVISIGRTGLRQTFFEKGQLRFSRLTPTNGGSIEEIAIACALETDKIYQYLASQRLVVRGTPLPTLVLAHPDDAAVIRGHCPDTPERQAQFVDLLALGRQSGLRSLPADSLAEPLFLHCLARRPPAQQLAPPADRHLHRLGQVRAALRATALAAVGLSLAAAAVQGERWLALESHNGELQRQLEDKRARYDSMLRALPRVPLSNEQLRLLTDRYGSLVPRSGGLESLLLPLSRGLDRLPGVELVRLDWRLADKPDQDRGRPSASPATGGAKATFGYAILDVDARLPMATAAAPRRQQQLLEDLVAAVAADGGVEARILAMPFDTTSGTTLRGGSGSTAPSEAPAFRLRLARKL